MESRGLTSSFIGDQPSLTHFQRKWGVIGAYMGNTIVSAVCVCIVYLMSVSTDYRMGLLVVIILSASTFGVMSRFAQTEPIASIHQYSAADLTKSEEETQPLADDSAML